MEDNVAVCGFIALLQVRTTNGEAIVLEHPRALNTSSTEYALRDGHPLQYAASVTLTRSKIKSDHVRIFIFGLPA